jgi:hypothetical protein
MDQSAIEDRLRVQADELPVKEEGVIRVLVGLPHEGMTGSEAYTNRLSNFKYLGQLEERGRLLKSNPRFEFLQYTCGRMHVFFAREEMAKQTLAANCDYLYMVDDDMTCPDDMFEKLYAADKDIVAPLAFTRNFPHKPVIYSCIEGWDAVSQKEYFSNFSIMNYPKDALKQVDAVGFGAVLIKAEVIKAIAEPRFMSTCGTGEDILFCYKAKKAGFQTWVDTRVKLGHISHPLIITEDYVQAQWNQHGMEVSKRYGEIKKYDKEAVLVLGD